MSHSLTRFSQWNSREAEDCRLQESFNFLTFENTEFGVWTHHSLHSEEPFSTPAKYPSSQLEITDQSNPCMNSLDFGEGEAQASDISARHWVARRQIPHLCGQDSLGGHPISVKEGALEHHNQQLRGNFQSSFQESCFEIWQCTRWRWVLGASS